MVFSLWREWVLKPTTISLTFVNNFHSQFEAIKVLQMECKFPTYKTYLLSFGLGHKALLLANAHPSWPDFFKISVLISSSFLDYTSWWMLNASFFFHWNGCSNNLQLIQSRALFSINGIYWQPWHQCTDVGVAVVSSSFQTLVWGSGPESWLACFIAQRKEEEHQQKHAMVSKSSV